MKTVYTLLCLALIITACSSSKPDDKNIPTAMKEEYPNLITLNPPEKQNAKPSKIYIDSAEVIDYKNRKALLISGNLANTCTYLSEVTHKTEGDTLIISLKGWAPADKMCATVLKPFSYIYTPLPDKEVTGYSTAKINNATFKIK